MIDELQRDFAVSGTALGLLSGAYFYTYAAVQVPVGMLIDRFGARRLLSLAMLVCVFASAWMAVSASLQSASLARALIGAAVAFGFVGTLSIIARFFPANHFALMAGILQSAGMLGAVLGQAPLRLMVEQLEWRGTLWVLSLVAFILAALLWTCLPRHNNQPNGSKSPVSNPFRGLGDVIKRRQNWLGAGLGFGLASTMLAFAGLWAVPWLEQVYGYTTASAAFLASLNFIGVAVGSPLLGWWSDRLGKRKPVLLTGAVAGFSCTLALVYGGPWSTPILATLIFTSGLAAAAIPLTFATMRELNPHAQAGTALGLTNMFVVGSGAILQPLIGALLDQRSPLLSDSTKTAFQASDFQWAFYALLAANGLALICTLLIRESNCKNLTEHEQLV